MLTSAQETSGPLPFPMGARDGHPGFHCTAVGGVGPRSRDFFPTPLMADEEMAIPTALGRASKHAQTHVRPMEVPDGNLPTTRRGLQVCDALTLTGRLVS